MRQDGQFAIAQGLPLPRAALEPRTFRRLVQDRGQPQLQSAVFLVVAPAIPGGIHRHQQMAFESTAVPGQVPHPPLTRPGTPPQAPSIAVDENSDHVKVLDWRACVDRWSKCHVNQGYRLPAGRKAAKRYLSRK